MAKKSGSSTAWILGLLGLGGLVALASSASAGETSDTKEEQAGKMLEAINALLTSKKLAAVPSYITATSETAEIVDTSGAGKVLSQTHQGITDNLHHFFWETNALLKFKNFSSTDTARWDKYVASYNKAISDLTGYGVTYN